MAESVQVGFVLAETGAERTLRPPIGATLLEAAQAGGIAMEATCGARGRCRSCRVKLLAGQVSPPTVQETLQLGREEVNERFRLACQTKVIADCKVMAAPPMIESGHQILSSDRFAAQASSNLDSGVRKYAIGASAPTREHHQTAIVDQIFAALPGAVERQLPLDVLRKVPGLARKNKGGLTVTAFNDRVIDIEAGDTTAQCYGMAFDIGTTSIVGTLHDLASGEQLAAVGGLNPQAQFGGDLMSRIAYVQFNEQKLHTLRAKVLNAINAFVRQACAEAGVRTEHIYKIVVVGNTCMHHIFLGVDVTTLGLAPYAAVVRDPLVYPAKDLPLKAAPNAQVCLLPIVAGFVGADTIACVLATRIYESDEIRALVDIGTNGEVVMGSKERLVACSTPAGPAFEGAQIRHGMRGALGAIEKLSIAEDVECGVIGGVPGIGICGSGLIDACAAMIEARVLNPSGLLRRKDLEMLPARVRMRLRTDLDGQEFVLLWKADGGRDQDISLTQADIRQLQLAKSAIYSGIVTLQRVMRVPDGKLAELMLCGAFGNYINIANAVRIRLVPGLPLDRITYMGNAAAIGAQMALLSETERMRAFELAGRIEHVALAAQFEFQETFVEGMNFSAPGSDPSEAG